ncbi:unnamed protein product [Cuscuta epithymum]|uniref:Uncharacterized protein n=1 Tax=Cuscuta epithymum TaxID=186058 RepID=A0AAV0FLZ0_9ASTE|nr:unnamed protein product [Cuscuta epithymum]CAH9136302.1 unnamed protein product [Cuscuta epithymum]
MENLGPAADDEVHPTRIRVRPNRKPRIVIEDYMPALGAYLPRETEPVDVNVIREINARLTSVMEDVRVMKRRLTRIVILQLLCLMVAISGLLVKLFSRK